eukprot:359004-Chlamydomonas_euryale.AAC.4
MPPPPIPPTPPSHTSSPRNAGLNALFSGVLRGCGRQGLGAYLNLAGWWGVVVPLGVLLGMHYEMGPWGFNAALAVGTTMQVGGCGGDARHSHRRSHSHSHDHSDSSAPHTAHQYPVMSHRHTARHTVTPVTPVSSHDCHSCRYSRLKPPASLKAHICTQLLKNRRGSFCLLYTSPSPRDAHES